jgi:hypothetical protein
LSDPDGLTTPDQAIDAPHRAFEDFIVAVAAP